MALITRASSFPRAVEFWAKPSRRICPFPQNINISAEFCAD